MTSNNFVELRNWSKNKYLSKYPDTSNRILKEYFKKKYNLYMEEARKKLLNDVKTLGYNLEQPGIQSRNFRNGTRLNLDVLDEDKRGVKKTFQDKASQIFVDTMYDYNARFEKVAENYNIEDRETREFLCGVTTNKLNLQLENFFSTMRNPKTKPEQKKALFLEFMNKGVEKYKDTKAPQNDTEGIEYYKSMYQVGKMFSNDSIDVIYHNITNQYPDREVREKWEESKALCRDSFHYCNALFQKLSNPLYPYFDDKSFEKFGFDFLENEQNINFADLPLKVEDLPEMTASLTEPIGVYQNTLLMKQKNFEKAKKDFEFNVDNDVFFTKDKYISNEQDAINAVAEDKTLYVYRGDAQRFIVTNNKAGFVNARPIYNLTKEDKQAMYKYCLNTLNKGTRWYIRSSDEYRNMRNILGQLSRNEGDELQLLTDLNKNIEKYEEKYFFKEKKSDLANERMGYVNAIKLDVQSMLDAKEFEAVDNRLSHGNQNENERHQIDLEQGNRVYNNQRVIINDENVNESVNEIQNENSSGMSNN